MKQTKGAIGNLLNRYRAVLKKCHLLNTFGSLAVASMLVMGGAGVAQATTVMSGEELLNAVTEATHDGAITVGQDISQGVGVSFPSNHDVTIDFGGHTYTAYKDPAGSEKTKSQLFQLLKDSTITLKNGNLNVSSEASGRFLMVLQNYSNLTLENMVVDGTNLQGSSPYTMSNNYGDITISNSTIIAKDGGIAFDVYYGLSDTYDAVGINVNVEKSTITGKIEVTVADRVSELAEGAKHKLSLSGGTLTGGLKTEGNGAQLENWGTTTISNVVISSNEASGYGGAIYNSDDKNGAKGILTLNDVSLTGNQANFGGALWNDGTAYISGKDFTGNNAISAGGAIYNSTDATLTLDSVTFESNTSAKSGAINNYDGTVNITGSRFVNNSAGTGMGGAISNVSGKTDKEGTINIVNSEFDGNNGGNGGAIWQGTEGVVNITGSTFTNNTALTGDVQQGGAITNAGKMTVAMSEFSGNEAGKIGGAIANVDQNGASFVNKLKLENIDVHDNWAGESGGGIYNSANQTIDFTGTNAIVDNYAGEDRTANDLYNAGSVNINDGSTTIAALTNDTGATITVAAENTAATLSITQSWTGNGKVDVRGLGTFAVNKDVILDADNTVKEGLTQASLEDGAIYKINGLDGGEFTTDELTSIKESLLGAGANGLMNFGNITISDIETTDCGAGDHIAYNPDSGITSTAYTADVTSVQNGSGIEGAFKSIHLTDTTDQLVAKGNLNLAGFEANSENNALVMNSNGGTSGLRIGSALGGADGKTSVVTLGDLTKDNTGSLGQVSMNAGNGKTATLQVFGNGNAKFEIGEISTATSDNTVWVDGAHLTTGSIAPYANQVLNKLSVNNGSVTTNGTALIGDIDLADGSTFTTKATEAEGSGAVTVTGKVTGQGEVIADKSLTFKNGLTTGEEANLLLTAGTDEYTGTVSFEGNLVSTVGTVYIDADTLTVNGTTTLVEDTVRAGQWIPGNSITAEDSLVQVGQFGNDENGASSLTQNLDLNGNTLFVHGSTDGATLAQAQQAAAGHQGTAYYTNKTLNLAEANGKLAAGTVDLGDNAVAFGADSMLIVDSSALDKGQAFTYGTVTGPGAATASVAEGAQLHAVNVQHGQNVVIFGDGFAQGMDTVAGWDSVTTDTPMLTASYDNTTNSLKIDAQNARDVYPDLSDEMASLVNQYYIEGLNTTGKGAGSEFLRRATHGDRYLAGDRKAAASTIESAARIAFAGAVPQMTKMASDAATNAVVNRLGFANPDNGAKAMNVDGKLVDDKALGLALWIAPLWSNQTGFGMEAGNLDYGYNANLGGISLGADYTWANNIRAGLIFNIGGGYAESAGGDLSETTNSMTFWGVGAYGGWEYKNFAVMADVSYTSTWNSVDQDVDHRMGMGDLEADIQASAISAGLRFEYKLETQYLDFIPHVGARYMSINTWGYDVDSSMGTILEGDGFQQNIWTFPVGITFSKELEMNNDWYFKPSVDFTVIPAAGDIKAKEDVRFCDVPISAELETQMMDYFTWQGGVGLEFGNDNMSVGVNYTLQAGQNSTGHGVFGMFRYEF